MTKTVAVLNAMARPMLEPLLPDWIEPRWFAGAEELLAAAPDAEIGWYDAWQFNVVGEALQASTKLKWINTVGAGVEVFPLELLRTRGVTLTNGAGLNAITIAEYALMGMLTVAKGYREVVRALSLIHI